MAHGDTPGVFSELKELKGSRKKAAPMTLGMHGYSEAREDLALTKKRKRKRVAVNFKGRPVSSNIDDHDHDYNE